jgi:hypothetical protein
MLMPQLIGGYGDGRQKPQEQRKKKKKAEKKVVAPASTIVTATKPKK